MKIRVAQLYDAKDIQKIYAPYVEKTNITFEYDIPCIEEMESRIEQTLEKYPYLVALQEEKIVGYAYASPFQARQAYQWDCELSIYMGEQYHGQGISQSLYQGLFHILKLMNIQNVYACITYPNLKSEKFHQKLGFSLVGCFHQTGYKFGKWHDMIWMEKHIGDYQQVKDIIPFSQLSSAQIEICFNNSYVQ